MDSNLWTQQPKISPSRVKKQTFTTIRLLPELSTIARETSQNSSLGTMKPLSTSTTKVVVSDRRVCNCVMRLSCSKFSSLEVWSSTNFSLVDLTVLWVAKKLLVLKQSRLCRFWINQYIERSFPKMNAQSPGMRLSNFSGHWLEVLLPRFLFYVETHFPSVINPAIEKVSRPVWQY